MRQIGGGYIQLSIPPQKRKKKKEDYKKKFKSIYQMESYSIDTIRLYKGARETVLICTATYIPFKVTLI